MFLKFFFYIYFQKGEHFEFYEKISCYIDDSNKEIFSQETNATEPKLKCISEKNINLEEKAKYCFCSTNENYYKNKLILIIIKKE